MKFLDIPANHFSVRVASTDGLTLERHFPIASDTASVRHVAPSSTPGVFELSLPARRWGGGSTASSASGEPCSASSRSSRQTAAPN